MKISNVSKERTAMNEKLKNIRLEKGYSCDEAAALANIEPCTLEKFESGEETPSGEILMALAGAYGVEIDRLCGGEVAAHGDIVPDYNSITTWELWSKQLDTEYRQ